MAMTQSTAFLGAGRLLGDYGKIALLAVVLAGILFTFFFVFSPPNDQYDLGHRKPITGPEIKIKVPRLDPDILAKVRDQTRNERLVLEEEPFRHLLEKSAGIGPVVAEALGRPEEPFPIERLRENPSTWRGKYLAYRGKLIYRAPAREGHPLDGMVIQEGALETEDGEVVVFAVGRALDDDLPRGAWIDVEGFFMGLRDSNILVETEKAPMLVGPRAMRSMRPWEPVESLDPAVLDRIEIGTHDPVKGWKGLAAMRSQLEDGQTEGLWHLASHARARAPESTLPEWREAPAFSTLELLAQAKSGDLEPGTPVRILGTFVYGRWIPAETNPIGVEAWTEAWIQVRDLGSKPLPVWLPGRLRDDEIRRGASLEVRAYYFRNMAYETSEGERFTPLFVAADLDPYRVIEHPFVQTTGWIFGGIVALIIGLFFWVARADARRRRSHEERMARKRREQFVQDVEGARA